MSTAKPVKTVESFLRIAVVVQLPVLVKGLMGARSQEMTQDPVWGFSRRREGGGRKVFASSRLRERYGLQGPQSARP
jgi:hypothetical protein